MTEIKRILEKCDKSSREYLEQYLKNAPDWILDSFQVVRMKKGTTFIEEGEKADKVYILVKGSIIAVDYRVREMVYGFFRFRPVKAMGALEIIADMEKYMTTLITTENCVFLKIGRKQFEKWLKNDMNAFQMQTKEIGCYLTEQARKERLNVLLKATDRIALVLIRLYEIYSENGKSKIYLSRKDFMETTGLSERTVTRVLKELEGKGNITRSGWDIVLTCEQYLVLKELVDDKINKMGE